MKKNHTYILSIAILFVLLSACTDDYFKDETNLRIYIPEVEDKSISDLHLYLFDAKGRLVKERHSEYPFDEEMYIKQGIFRYNVPPGTYSVSCFANTQDDDDLKVEICCNDSLTNSFVSLSKNADRAEFNSSTDLRKVVKREIMVKPIGVSQELETVSMSEAQTHVGKIKYIFKGMPDAVDSIDICASGLSTRIFFDGVESYSGVEPDDISVSTKVEWNETSQLFSFEKLYFPTISDSNEFISMLVNFKAGDGSIIGTYNEKLKVVNENGHEISARLFSNQTITIIFEGFVISEVSIEDWGDIEPGDITPM